MHDYGVLLIEWLRCAFIRIVMSESSAVDSSASEGQKNGEQTLSDRTLRHVENDVLISKIIRKKAHEVCFDPFVRGQEKY